jgi:hypothetical protein
MNIFKRFLYILLLLAELVLDTLLMSVLWSITLVIPVLAIMAVSTGLLVWQIIALVRAADPNKKRKKKRNIALILLLPIAIFLILFIWFIVAMMIGF